MNTYIKSLIEFLDSSVCNFCAVETVKNQLNANGYKELKFSDSWTLEKNGKYYVTKNDSAIFAFVLGDKSPAETGFTIIAAHSDSPCFRVKPNAEI